MKTPGGDCVNLSDKALLARLLGVRNAQRLYRGSLSSLLRSAEAGCAATGRLFAAGELVRRALAEELQRQPAFSSPEVVKEFLKLTIGVDADRKLTHLQR